MISVKYAIIIAVGAFAAGAIFASPVPQAIASTIANDVQCTGCVGTSDLASNAVTATKIKADSVGGSELIGVTKLLFGQCAADSFEGTTIVGSGNNLVIACTINGVDSDDSAIALVNTNNSCFDLKRAFTITNGVIAIVKNECSTTSQFGTGTKIGIIVFDK